MCLGGTGTAATTGLQTMGGHTFATPAAVSPALYSSGIPAITNYANYAAPTNYYKTPAAVINPTGGYAANALRNAPTGLGIGSGSASGSAKASASSMLSGLPIGTGNQSIKGQSMTPSFLSRLGTGTTSFLKEQTTGQNLLNNISKLTPLITSLIPAPKYEGQTSADLKSMLSTESATAEGAAARAKMLEYINNPEKIGGTATTDYVKALQTDHDASDAATLAKFDSDWQAAGYSTTGSDYFKAKGDLQAKLDNQRNTEVGAAQAALYQTQLTAQLEMISQQYGIEMQLLSDMMNMDIYSAAQKYGLKAQEITDFKNAINALIQGSVPNTENAAPTA